MSSVLKSLYCSSSLGSSPPSPRDSTFTLRPKSYSGNEQGGWADARKEQKKGTGSVVLATGLITYIVHKTPPPAPYIEYAEQHLDKNLASRVNLHAPES